MPVRSVAKEELSDVLSEFARTMVTNFPIQGILDHLVRRIVDILPVTAAGVTLIAPGVDPRYVAASDPSALRYEMLQTELGEGPCLAAFDTGNSVSVPDLRVASDFGKFVPRALEAGLAAVFTFPLRHEDMRLGALDLYRDTPGPLSQKSTVTAQTLADVAAAYLINAQARADLQDSRDQSRAAALHDPLTGLPNRVLILQLLEHAFRAGRRSKKIAAVFFVDLDRFKDVNDTHGHQTGDELLIAVSQRLTGMLRPGDNLARLAGDEFVIVCEDLADASAADPIAARLAEELGRPFSLTDVEITTGASIGIAFTGPDVDSPEALLHDADLAMYRVKHNRRRTHGVVDLRQLQLVGQQAGLARALTGAIDRRELHLNYQPIVDARDGRVTEVEALLRWTHPARGSVPPAVFIPFAEQSGQIIELGRFVLEQACADRRHWQEHSPTEIAMSVNVSAHQLMSAGFVRSVATALTRTATAPSLLTLELTESVIVSDEGRALIILEQLKDVGVKLALDDFGTGYSSLGYLTTLPIDTIKVDRTFIAKLSEQPSSREIVTAIIGLAHSLGMTVVAEGVETVEQRRQVTQLGSDRCQGFYFAKPMSASLVDPLVCASPDGSSPRLPSGVPIEPGQAGESPAADAPTLPLSPQPA
jgi:diguanylate cyclase (GGDEF)-like protein